MTTLGKIFFILLSTVLFAHISYAFEVSVNTTSLQQGDQLVVTFTSQESDDFPTVGDIGGVAIQNQSTSSQTRIINGQRTNTYSVRYIITPSKSFTIPSYTMKENGKPISSKPIDIKVIARKQDANSDLFFTMKASRHSVYVGEPFVVTLTFKQAQGLEIVDAKLTPPSGEHFWVDKNNVKQHKSQTNTHSVQSLDYLFTAQKPGTHTIDAAHIQVGKRSYQRDAWGMISMVPKYTSLFSKPITIEVLPLPKQAQTIGNFTLDVDVDKTSSDEKTPVNVTITLKGTGNIEDIKPYTLDIEHALIYDEKPKRDFSLKNSAYYGSFVQKFAIVSDTNYTIPALKFSYFDKQKQKLVTLKSKPIHITITPKEPKQIKPLHIEQSDTTDKTDTTSNQTGVNGLPYYTAILFVLFGVVLGYFLRMLLPAWHFKAKKSQPKTPVQTDKQKALLQALLVHSHDSEAKKFIDILSENIYNQAEHDINTKELKALKKRLNIR